MKKIYKLLPILIVAIFLSSCGIVKNSGKYHEKSVSNAQIDTDELRADMEIDETNKISGSASATYFLFFKLSGDNHYADIAGGGFDVPFSKTSGPKKAAQYKALNSAKVDFIAKPSYTIKKTTYLLGLMTIVDADVTGYGGVYKNFKQIDPLERNVELLKAKIIAGGKVKVDL
tara:strand:+ start:278 stop:796 length:519 start_codon:yes stop_codon:yes gene_type:complete